MDLNHLEASEDDDNPRTPIIDRLIEFLPSVDDKPYLSVFVLTHPDQDHCRERLERVIITDGGVYDNLGLSCFEPGRSPKYGVYSFSPDYLICCDAGAGQLGGDVFPYWWASRMKRSFETTFRRNLTASYGRLHEWANSGKIEGFVLSYLGQQDASLPAFLEDLVRRDEVWAYPTDFSPMSDTDIELISLRGEQLTRLLISYYCPNL